MIYALHGFLGVPRDWAFLFEKFSNEEIFTEDLFSYQIDSLWSWADQFNRNVRSRHCTSPRVLLGYSLGGRLALHALCKDSDLWDAAIIVSAHYGLDVKEQRQEKRFIDEAWADRFENEEWEALMHLWNSQEIFQNSHNFHRCERDYSRKQLAASLCSWSLGCQQPLQQAVNQLPIPILWITGSEDVKYTELAKKLCLKHPHSKICILSHAGHRAPWEQPEQFLQNVNAFLNTLS